MSLFTTARAISEKTPEAIPWIVTGYVAERAITEAAGKAKVAGKTTLLLHLTGRVLDGAPFLGMTTTASPVVYLTEQHATTFREQLRRAHLLDREDLSILSYWDVAGRPWAEIAGLAIAEAERIGARLLVVDTLSQFAGLEGDSENNAGSALAALEPLQRAAAKGLGVIVARHERKGGGEVGESGRGSSAFTGGVDVVLSIRRPEGHHRSTIRSIEALSRFEETPASLLFERIVSAQPQNSFNGRSASVTWWENARYNLGSFT